MMIHKKDFVRIPVKLTVAFVITIGSVYFIYVNTCRTQDDKTATAEEFPIDTAAMPPCGEICNYNWKDEKRLEVKERGEISKTYMKKTVNCKNMLLRMKNAGEGIIPPPEQPPLELKQAFEQNGEMPITKYWYFGKRKMEYRKTHFSKVDIDRYVGDIKLGYPVGPYMDTVIGPILQKYKTFLEGKRGIVLGTVTPWLEAHLLNVGVSHVTTVDYNRIHLVHPRLDFKLHTELVDAYLQSNIQFDFAASYSSLEHAGLGRYGDPLNPYGDLEASAQIWCLLKPGGLFFFGAYVDKKGNIDSEIHWNAHRIYGLKRLLHIGANWKVKENDAFSSGHKIIVYEKPYSYLSPL